MGLLIAAVALAWLCLAWAIASLMGRRGHERLAWWIVAMVMGPAAVPLAGFELLASNDRRPRALKDGQVRGGDLSVLVHVDATPGSRDAASAAADLFAPWLGRLCLVKVLPTGGPRLIEHVATQELRRQAADWAPGAALTVVFGRPDTALGEYATSEGYALVVLASPDRATTQALRAAGVVVLDGASGVERMSVCGHLAGQRTENNQTRARTAPVTRRQTKRNGHHVLQEPAS